MSQPSVALVRAQAVQYRGRVASSCGSALTAEETALVGKEAARAAARRAVDEAVTSTWGPIGLVGPLLVAAALPWIIRKATTSPVAELFFPFSWLSRVIETNDAPGHYSALFYIGFGLLLFTVALVLLSGSLLDHLASSARAVHAGRVAFVHSLALCVVAVSLILFAVPGGVHGGQWSTTSEILARTAARIASAVLALLVIGLAIAVCFVTVSVLLGWVIRPIMRPYDPLLLALVDACAVTHAHRDTWFLPNSRKAVERSLKNAARQAETAVPARPFPGGRELARADTLRLAAVIRQHRIPIARASGPASFDLVAQSLWSGVIALIDDDWDALTAAAEPVTALSRLRRTAATLWPPVVLLAAAIALPWIPGVEQAPALVNGLRVTLVVTAVLGLALPRESAARTSILDALGKALPSRTEK
ncbi:hypothetical protein ACFU76_16335 [Streptomyces sp. NPDC057539]|uniref:hypothetical protein n=1 Tax=Streptomyces sp. NPDC057539 TaxID=3346159 RepID=UPI00367A72A6